MGAAHCSAGSNRNEDRENVQLRPIGQPPPERAPTPRGRPLFAAPHRAMFLSGAAMLLLGFGLWMLALMARVGWVADLPWHQPPGWMHALWVLGCVFPFFVFGFLLTAMPRWQGAGDLPRSAWLWPWRLLALGWLGVLVGAFVPGVALAGLVSVAAGWAGVTRVLWRVVRHPSADRRHALLTTSAVTAGGLGMVVWFVGLAGGGAGWVRAAVAIGVWWCLVPVFVTVCHRMLPFFTSGVVKDYVVVRPQWALVLLNAGSVAHGVGAMLEGGRAMWLCDAPVGIVALYLSWRWWARGVLRVPLLGMLHLGFIWLGVAFLLSAVQSAAAVAGWSIMGLVPMHVLGIGFFGSMLLAMVSRVTLGHSGRPLQADWLTWGLFLGLQPVVLLRVAADLLDWPWAGYAMVAAVTAWWWLFVAWGWRYMPMYWRERVDGKAG